MANPPLSTSLTETSPAVPAPAVLSKPRLLMIDVAKGIGILLIVLGHNPDFSQHFHRLAEFLSAFRLPFFFFVSGVMFSVGKRSTGTVVKERADAWLKPVAVVVIAAGIINLAMGRTTPEAILLALVYPAGFTMMWPALWFLPHIWLLYIAVTVLMNAWPGLSDRNWKRVLLVGGLIVFGDFVLKQFDNPLSNRACHTVTTFTSDLFNCGLPFSADLLPLTAAFFLLGYFLSAKTKQFKLNFWLLALALFVMAMCQWMFTVTVDLNYRRYDSLVVSTLQAFAGIYIMLCLCSMLSRLPRPTAILAYCGQASLFILIFHTPILARINYSLPRLVSSELVVGIAAFVGPLVLSVLLWKICQRIEPLARLMLPVKNRRLSQNTK